MKICILTQPLQTNYGGLLQNYALQTVLRRMGHEVWTEDRKENNNFFKFIKRNIKPILWPLIQKSYFPTFKEKKIIAQHTNEFINKYIRVTFPVQSTNKTILNDYAFDAYIVGSDQVWRPMYSYGLYNYFLDFTIGKNVKRIAYAASFGTDQWELNPMQTLICAQLVKNFNAVSVREDSGIELCKKYLGVDAVQVLDPTLLLDKSEYLKIIQNDNISNKHYEGVMTYFLDDSKIKQDILQSVCNSLSLNSYSVMPEAQFSNVGRKGIAKCIYPSVADWLQGFVDADFVVTDSFHGTVFSIIFNKPFISIANIERGATRFSSLLKIFGLEDRLISSHKDFNDSLLKEIDFTKINTLYKNQREASIHFLSNALE